MFCDECNYYNGNEVCDKGLRARITTVDVICPVCEEFKPRPDKWFGCEAIKEENNDQN